MALKITINDREIRNPVAKLIISLLMSVVMLALLLLLFFLLLPLMWFMGVAILTLTIAVFGGIPVIQRRYRVLLLKQSK